MKRKKAATRSVSPQTAEQKKNAGLNRIAAAAIARISPAGLLFPSMRTVNSPATHAIPRSARIHCGSRTARLEERLHQAASLRQSEKHERVARRIRRKARVVEVRRAEHGQTDGPGAEVVEVELKPGIRGDDQPEDQPENEQTEQSQGRREEATRAPGFVPKASRGQHAVRIREPYRDSEPSFVLTVCCP